MHRSFGGSVAICGIGWLVMAGASSAQDARPSTLPAVEVDAPRPRKDIVARQRRRADKQGASKPDAPRKPPSGDDGAATSGGQAVAPIASSSEKNVTGEDVNARPFSRPGEALEVVPGLIVTQHSGEGKANQYFLRGFNLDHGTDLAISVDDMPVNMRTHAHGQGYADLNFLIPELIGSVDVRKGPYFADEGDFSSVGSVHVGPARFHQQDDGIDHVRQFWLPANSRRHAGQARRRDPCCWPARSTPITDRGTIPTGCASSMRLRATARVRPMTVSR